MSTVALVPARGGSQALPGKNLAEVGGLSLVARAVGVGSAVATIDEVVVSSNDPRILAAAEDAGAQPEKRPDCLAADDIPTLAVVQSFLIARPDITTIVVLQPTSPFRIPEDVERCLAKLQESPTATTVTETEHPVEWLFTLSSTERLIPLLAGQSPVPRRQEARTAFRLNGAVYAARADHVRSGGSLVEPDTAVIVMPRARSVDIDEEFDLVVARALVNWMEKHGDDW